MIQYCFHKRKHLFYRPLVWLSAVIFVFNSVLPVSYAANLVNKKEAESIDSAFLFMPPPGTKVNLSESYEAPVVMGIRLYPDNPLKIDFIIDQGDFIFDAATLTSESERLIKYFFATLTIPEKDLWVNLSPYEPDRIIAPFFSQTDMGRDMLAQDYVLKQLTASLMYPENEMGELFWDRIYEEMFKVYGTRDISIDTFNKVWILPEKAVVYEQGTSAYVIERHLKVLMEEDYLVLQNELNNADSHLNNSISQNEQQRDSQLLKSKSKLASKIIKELIIPAIEKEVNEGRNFALLRQIYNSMILASWYKVNLKKGLLAKIYVDQNKTKGIGIDDPDAKAKIYAQYIDNFRKGTYDFIREELDPLKKELINRRYFLGGQVFSTVQSKVMRGRVSAPTDKGIKYLERVEKLDHAFLVETQSFAFTDETERAIAEADEERKKDLVDVGMLSDRGTRRNKVLAALGLVALVAGGGGYLANEFLSGSNSDDPIKTPDNGDEKVTSPPGPGEIERIDPFREVDPVENARLIEELTKMLKEKTNSFQEVDLDLQVLVAAWIHMFPNNELMIEQLIRNNQEKLYKGVKKEIFGSEEYDISDDELRALLDEDSVSKNINAIRKYESLKAELIAEYKRIKVDEQLRKLKDFHGYDALKAEKLLTELKIAILKGEKIRKDLLVDINVLLENSQSYTAYLDENIHKDAEELERREEELIGLQNKNLTIRNRPISIKEKVIDTFKRFLIPDQIIKEFGKIHSTVLDNIRHLSIPEQIAYIEDNYRSEYDDYKVTAKDYPKKEDGLESDDNEGWLNFMEEKNYDQFVDFPSRVVEGLRSWTETKIETLGRQLGVNRGFKKSSGQAYKELRELRIMIAEKPAEEDENQQEPPSEEGAAAGEEEKEESNSKDGSPTGEGEPVEPPGEDDAMIILKRAEEADGYGGINFDPALLNLQIKRDSMGVPLSLEYQSLQGMQIEGLIPVIMEFHPIYNLPMFIGFNPREDKTIGDSALFRKI